jgi:hypothetical protein
VEVFSRTTDRDPPLFALRVDYTFVCGPAYSRKIATITAKDIHGQSIEPLRVRVVEGNAVLAEFQFSGRAQTARRHVISGDSSI